MKKTSEIRHSELRARQKRRCPAASGEALKKERRARNRRRQRSEARQKHGIHRVRRTDRRRRSSRQAGRKERRKKNSGREVNKENADMEAAVILSGRNMREAKPPEARFFAETGRGYALSTEGGDDDSTKDAGLRHRTRNRNTADRGNEKKRPALAAEERRERIRRQSGRRGGGKKTPGRGGQDPELLHRRDDGAENGGFYLRGSLRADIFTVWIYRLMR